MRPSTASAFVSGNVHPIYKCPYQIQNNKEQLTDLNDALFSHSLHPNSGTAWSLLYSVTVHQPEDYVCPICYFAPVAPRMLHCGHIFCADCLARYMLDDTNVICPVCEKSLLSFPPIRADLHLYPKINSFVFRRISRNRNNCICFLDSDTNKTSIPTASSHSSLFNHITIADPSYIQSTIEKERQQLQEQIKIYSEYPNETLKIELIQATLEDLNNEKSVSESQPTFILPAPKENIKFYQEINGRLIFLDPLSVQMLTSQFGSIDNAPDPLEAPTLKITSMKVDQQFRNRYRFYSHLSTGADVMLVLADFSSICDQTILQKFSPEIERQLQDDIPPTPVEDRSMSAEFFPSLSSSQPGPSMQTKSKSPWAQVAPKPIDEQFPSFGQAKLKKSTGWGVPSVNQESTKTDRTPSFPGNFKKKSSWL